MESINSTINFNTHQIFWVFIDCRVFSKIKVLFIPNSYLFFIGADVNVISSWKFFFNPLAGWQIWHFIKLDYLSYFVIYSWDLLAELRSLVDFSSFFNIVLLISI